MWSQQAQHTYRSALSTLMILNTLTKATVMMMVMCQFMVRLGAFYWKCGDNGELPLEMMICIEKWPIILHLAVGSCTVFPGTDFDGHDLKRGRTGTFEQCCSLCDGTAGCGFWTFQPPSKCYMKTSAAGKRLSPRAGNASYTSGCKDISCAVPPPAPPEPPGPSSPGPSPSRPPPCLADQHTVGPWLFNLKIDPYEHTNLYATQPQRAKELVTTHAIPTILCVQRSFGKMGLHMPSNA